MLWVLIRSALERHFKWESTTFFLVITEKILFGRKKYLSGAVICCYPFVLVVMVLNSTLEGIEYNFKGIKSDTVKCAASVAQLDVLPTGDQEVAVSVPLDRQHSFVEIDHEIFSTVILSLHLIQEGQLSVSSKRMWTVLVNHLEN